MKRIALLFTLILSLFLTSCTQPVPAPNASPTITNPGDQTSTVGENISLQMNATDPEDDLLSFSATGLPDGLSMNNTGLISGTPSNLGTSIVSVTADDGNGNQPSIGFSWQVTNAPIVETFVGSAYNYPSLQGGQCGFDIDASNLDVVSINSIQYGTADLCGSRIEVTGDKGSKVLLVADQLNQEEENAISMPRETLAEIVNVVPAEGELPAQVSWKLTFPEDIGTLSYQLKDVNAGFTAILVKNNRTPISKLECRPPGESSVFREFTRQDFNFFWGPGLGLDTITCRITDSFGVTVEEKDIPAPAGASSHIGTEQFPVPTAPATE